MAYEIFIEPELENLQEETVAAEWFEICSELGLQKQLSLTDKSDEKKAPPYMFCDPKTKKIIDILCPREVPYTEYSASTIPLDVVKEIQKCVKHGWYKKIVVCYDDQSPDPFVIGLLPFEYEWRAERHIIARWGAELIPFEQMEEKAVNRLMDQTLEKLNDFKGKVEYALSNPAAYIRKKLAGERLLTELPF